MSYVPPQERLANEILPGLQIALINSQLSKRFELTVKVHAYSASLRCEIFDRLDFALVDVVDVSDSDLIILNEDLALVKETLTRKLVLICRKRLDARPSLMTT
jgi:hypothetical protein